MLKISLFLIAFSLFLISGNAFLGLFENNPQFLIIESDLNITDLGDVNVSGVTNDQILIFNSTTLQWENQNQTAASGSRTYTGIDPITVDNDFNLIGWNPGTTTDWNGLFDGLDSNEFGRLASDNNFTGDNNFSRLQVDNFFGDISGATGYTLDQAYNAESGDHNVTIDDGDIFWNVTPAAGTTETFTVKLDATPDVDEGTQALFRIVNELPPEFGFDEIFVVHRSRKRAIPTSFVGLKVMSVDWFPLADATYDLGGTMPDNGILRRWRDLYLSGTIKGVGSSFVFDLNGTSGNFDTVGDVNSLNALFRGDVNNNFSGSDANFNNLEADFFFGDGSGLTNLPNGVTGVFEGGNIDVNANTGDVLISFDDGNFLLSNHIWQGDNNFTGLVDMNGFSTGDALSGDMDLIIGRAGAGSGGCIGIGDYQICDTGNMGIVGDMNLDDMFIIRDMDGVSNIAFMLITPGNLPRFIIPREGPDFATNNTRSFILGGDIGQDLNDSIILCSANGYDKIDCDTNATGADLGVQDDAQIRGSLFVDENVLVDGNLTASRINTPDLNAQDATFTTKGLVVINPRYLDVNNGELNFDANTQDLLHFFNGTFLETIDVDVNSNGTDVNLFVQKEGGGDLTIVFDSGDGYVFFDSTPPATIELTVGSDTNPTLNYVFIPQSTNVLTVNTTGFPTDAEHAPVATVVVQSATSAVVDGLYKVHVWTDHSDDEDTHQGHESHINSWIRKQPATWQSDVSQTLTITTNASRPDNVDFAVTSGIVLQLHNHAYPAFDTAIDSNIFVVNDSGAAFTKVDDLNALLIDSTGASMSGRYFTLVIAGVVSEDSKDSKLMVNLPSGSYNKESDAIADVSGFANFTSPTDFVGTWFLISKLVLRHQAASGGTWTSIQEGDLRGLFPSIAAAGGSGAAVTSFSDNLFELFNVTDATKLLNFDLSDMATATTATWFVPTRDINFAAPVFDDLNVLNDANFNKVEADFFFGDGSGLTGLPSSDVNGTDIAPNFVTVTTKIDTLDFNAEGNDINFSQLQAGSIFGDISSATGYTLDNAYNAGGNTITVDTDDVIWNLDGSSDDFIIQSSGDVGFQVNKKNVAIDGVPVSRSSLLIDNALPTQSTSYAIEAGVTHGSSVTAAGYGVFGFATASSVNNADTIAGIFGRVLANGGSHDGNLIGGLFSGGNTLSSGTITNSYGVKIIDPTQTGGGVTNLYGLFIDPVTFGGSNYGIYIGDANTYSVWVDNGLTRLDGSLELQGDLNADDWSGDANFNNLEVDNIFGAFTILDSHLSSNVALLDLSQLFTADINALLMNVQDLNIGSGNIQVNGVSFAIDADLNLNAISAGCAAAEFLGGDGTCQTGGGDVNETDINPNFVLVDTDVNAARDINAGRNLYVDQNLTIGNGVIFGNDIGVRVHNTSSQTITTSTILTLTFDSERWDTDTIHSTSTNPSRLTVKTAGVYIITGHVRFSSAQTNGYRLLQILLNGTTAIAMNTVTAANVVPTDLSVSTLYNLDVNDYVELRVNQNSGSNLDITMVNQISPEFTVQRIAGS